MPASDRYSGGGGGGDGADGGGGDPSFLRVVERGKYRGEANVLLWRLPAAEIQAETRVEIVGYAMITDKGYQWQWPLTEANREYGKQNKNLRM